MEPPANERTRRARAAWGYSQLSQNALAVRANINPRTLNGYLLKTGAAPRMYELYAIVEAAGIARSFADNGFELIEGATDERRKSLSTNSEKKP